MCHGLTRANSERADHVSDVVLIFDNYFVTNIHFKFARNDVDEFTAHEPLISAKRNDIDVDFAGWFDNSNVGLVATRNQPNTQQQNQQARK